MESSLRRSKNVFDTIIEIGKSSLQRLILIKINEHINPNAYF